MSNIKITQTKLRELAQLAAAQIKLHFNPNDDHALRTYAIPRGGVAAALAVAQHIPLLMVDEPAQADLFIDDLIDSGKTLERWQKEFPETPFFALLDKRIDVGKYHQDRWIVFPWEDNEVGSFEDNVVRLLQFVGEDPSRGGLAETPARVTKAWKFWCSGYSEDPAEVLKVFADGAEKHDQMVTVKDIPFYSHCEHHLAPIFGTVTIGYIPNGKIVGLSKLSRLTNVFARRLQVQERMTDQIADALFQHLGPLGVGVMVRARHLCMESRGVCQQGHHTITTALRGVVKTSADAKAEFLRLAE